MAEKRINPVKGGKGDDLSICDVDQNELMTGMKHEMEHTADPEIALDIALDHLAEDPHYYTNLKKIEPEENEGIDALNTMRQFMGSLADEHPGSSGKDLSAYEGAVGPIAPRKIGSTAPHDDEEMCEDIQDDLGVKLKVTDEGDEVIFNLVIDGKVKGTVHTIEDSHVEGYWEIYNADFDLDGSGALVGKGLGMVLYPKMNKWLKQHKQAKGLSSDVTRSDAAERLWKKLVQAGKAKHKNLGISKGLDVYYFTEAWNVLENIFLVEDSRGNMKNLLKMPPEYVELFHKEYGDLAYPMAVVFLIWAKREIKNMNGYEIDILPLKTAWEIVEKNAEEEGSNIENLIDSFVKNGTDNASRTFFNLMKKNPSVIKKINTGTLSWENLSDFVANQVNPEDLKNRAKRYGIVFNDGYMWIQLEDDEHGQEGMTMQHCATDSCGELWSLRDKSGKPHVTMTYEDQETHNTDPKYLNGISTVHQIKGKQNTAPDPKYWKYIEDFFKKKKVNSLLDSELADTAPNLFSRLETITDLNTSRDNR